MGIKSFLKSKQVTNSVKKIEVAGENMHIRKLSVAESTVYQDLPQEDRITFLLKTSVCTPSGQPELTDEDSILINTAEDDALGNLVSEIIKHSFGVTTDPKP